MGSQERLTIIPHGVPYMTKLLRYFVSEDSIFLHLEHVQGEGTCALSPSPPPPPPLSPGEECGLLQMCGTDREPSAFLKAEGRTRLLGTSLWCPGKRGHPHPRQVKGRAFIQLSPLWPFALVLAPCTFPGQCHPWWLQSG